VPGAKLKRALTVLSAALTFRTEDVEMDADAARVIDHCKRVDSHEIVVNPNFYLGRALALASIVGYLISEQHRQR
jgi:hypothetical protein